VFFYIPLNSLQFAGFFISIMLKTLNKEIDLKKLYAVTFEKSMIFSLLLVIAFFHLCPVPKSKHREQKVLIPGFIVEDVPVTRQGDRKKPPTKPALPIPVDDPTMAEDETIDPTTLRFDIGSYYGEGGVNRLPILPPRPLVQVMPEYPLEEKKRGVSGIVVLSVEVNMEGKVTAVVVKENTTGSEMCSNAAIAAAQRCRYLPARRGKTPVTAWTICSYGFHPF